MKKLLTKVLASIVCAGALTGCTITVNSENNGGASSTPASQASSAASTQSSENSQAPAESSKESQSAPASSSQTPAQSSQTPAESSQAPAQSSQAPAQSSEQPATSIPDEPYTGKIEISFWHTFGKTLQDSISKRITTFEKLIEDKEGVDVDIVLRYQGSYDDIHEKISKGFSTSNIPTIAVAYPDHVADYLQAEGTNLGKYVVQLDPYMNDEKIGFNKESFLGDDHDASDFVPAYLEEGQQYLRNGTYSLPFLKSSEVMFYNKQGVTKAMTYYNPELASNSTKLESFLKTMSWDEFMDFCASINEHKSQISSALEVPAFYDSDSNLFITKMYQNEIPYSHVDERGFGVIDFKDGDNLSRAKEMVRALKANYDAGLITTKGAFGTYGSNNFLAQKTLFSIGSTGGAGYNFPSSEDFSVGVCRVPASNNNPIYVSQGPTLTLLKNPTDASNLSAQKIKYAWKFLKYITNAEVNTAICFDGSEGYMPVRTSAYETDLFMDFMENEDEYSATADVIISDIHNRFFNTAVFKGSTVLRDQVGGIIGDVFASGKSIDDAFKDAIDQTTLAMD